MARADGDRDLAARISALPKPSVTAWVLDLLAREAPDDLQRVLDLGADLREAQEDADRDRLRALTGERRTLLPDVARTAAALAEDAGQHVSDAVLEELQQTLQVVLASPAAAGAAPAAGRRSRSAKPEDGGEQQRRAAEEREVRLRDARDRARAAAASARDADAASEDRRHDVDDLRKRIDDLQARLDAAQEALDEAGSEAERAHRDAEDAIAEVDRLTADG